MSSQSLQASGQASAPDLTQHVGGDFLEKGCFFIYDSLHEEETADQEEIMLFFHPEEVPLHSKLFLQGKTGLQSFCCFRRIGYTIYFTGACSAMIAFASKFTNKPVDIVTLKHTKLAFKNLPGKISMVG